MVKIKEIAVNYEKFNKSIKPFIVKRYGKRVSVIPYKEAADYIFELHKRILRILDITNYKAYSPNKPYGKDK